MQQSIKQVTFDQQLEIIPYLEGLKTLFQAGILLRKWGILDNVLVEFLTFPGLILEKKGRVRYIKKGTIFLI